MPLTAKGGEIKSNMEREYGSKKGEEVFYASKNAGTISGVDRQDDDVAYKGYLIKTNPIRGNVWVEKGGHTISNPKSVEDAKRQIDDLTRSDMDNTFKVTIRYGQNYREEYVSAATRDEAVKKVRNALQGEEKRWAAVFADGDRASRLDAAVTVAEALSRRFDALCTRRGHG